MDIEDDEETDDITIQTIDVLRNISENTTKALECAKNLWMRICDGNLQTENGISFLEIKNQMLLNYLTDLTYLILIKVRGEQLSGNDVVSRLVEHRTVLEKMRPIDYKLKYQIDKLIKSAATGIVNDDDPTRLRVNISNIMTDDHEIGDDHGSDHEDDEYDGEDDDGHAPSVKSKEKKSGIYVPPKVAAVKYDDDDDKKLRALQRARRKAMSSSIIQELRREYDDAPEEVEDSTNYERKMLKSKIKERDAYEEEHMTRINLTKKQRNDTKQFQTMSGLSRDLTRFEDISALQVDDGDDFVVPNKKKRGNKSKNTKFKRKKFKKLRK